MKRFFRLRERKALEVRDEIVSFWLNRGVVGAPEGPSSRPLPTVSSSSSEESAGCAVERENARLMATRPSDEELLEWVLREQREREANNFAPACGR